MHGKEMTPEELQQKSVRELANIGGDSMTNVNVKVDNMGAANINYLKDWIKQGECNVLAEGFFHVGPEGVAIWRGAFENYGKPRRTPRAVYGGDESDKPGTIN